MILRIANFLKFLPIVFRVADKVRPLPSLLLPRPWGVNLKSDIFQKVGEKEGKKDMGWQRLDKLKRNYATV